MVVWEVQTAALAGLVAKVVAKAAAERAVAAKAVAADVEAQAAAAAMAGCSEEPEAKAGMEVASGDLTRLGQLCWLTVPLEAHDGTQLRANSIGLTVHRSRRHHTLLGPMTSDRALAAVKR